MRESVDRSSLLVPGRDDLSFFPPVGQLSFDTITAMNEHDIDQRISLHLQGASPFKKGSPTLRWDENRRLEIKRIFLAKLEGFSFRDTHFAEWYEGPKKELQDLEKALLITVSVHASDTLKKRIAEVSKKTAREAFLLSERTQEIQRVMSRINATLKNRKIITEDLNAHELINIHNTPRHEKIDTDLPRESDQWDIVKVLNLYLRRFSSDYVYKEAKEATAISRHTTKRAKDLYKKYKGFKISP